MNKPTPVPPTPPKDQPACPRLRSEDLFAGCKRVVIVHAERTYELRITTHNKLILTA